MRMGISVIKRFNKLYVRLRVEKEIPVEPDQSQPPFLPHWPLDPSLQSATSKLVSSFIFVKKSHTNILGALRSL